QCGYLILPISDAFDIDSNSLVSGSNNFGGNSALVRGGSHYYHYAGKDGDDQGIWNTINFPGGGNDTFGTIPVTDIATTKASMDFVFPLSDALTLIVGGKPWRGRYRTLWPLWSLKPLDAGLPRTRADDVGAISRRMRPSLTA